MKVEEELKALVLSTFGSMREFSMVLQMPYSTLDSIFKRGVENASIGNIIKICSALQISVDELAAGKVVHQQKSASAPEENELIHLYRELTAEGKGLALSVVRALAGNQSLRNTEYQSAAAIARSRARAAEQEGARDGDAEAHA